MTPLVVQTGGVVLGKSVLENKMAMNKNAFIVVNAEYYCFLNA